MPTTQKYTTVVNARIDNDILEQLDQLAEAMERTRSYLIAQAVREFVEREYAFLSAVREGEADADAGRSLTGEEARVWFDDLKAGRVKDAPPFSSKGSRKR